LGHVPGGREHLESRSDDCRSMSLPVEGPDDSIAFAPEHQVPLQNFKPGMPLTENTYGDYNSYHDSN